ncbi:MAG: hypothetical protein AAF961_19365 [Planctomycetota bacterium]
MTPSAWGADPETPAAESAPADGEASAAEETPQPKLFGLGEFHVRDLRPTRNETVDVRFSLYTVMSADASDAFVAALPHWRQRLRDQAIVAVRLCETNDFIEPGLDRLQQIIRLRINRTLGWPAVEQIYLNDFTLGDY